MLFRNDTNENIKVRVLENADQRVHSWIIVRPTKTVNLAKDYGLRMNLTSVKEKPEADPPEDPEESEEDTARADWMEEILAVDGVGQKTADDIIAKYPTRESIIESIAKGEHLPMKDNIADHFIEKYENADDSNEGDN